MDLSNSFRSKSIVRIYFTTLVISRIWKWSKAKKIRRYARKGIYHDCLLWIEKSVPRDHCWHHSASLVMPNSDHRDIFFFSHQSWKILIIYNLSCVCQDVTQMCYQFSTSIIVVSAVSCEFYIEQCPLSHNALGILNPKISDLWSGVTLWVPLSFYLGRICCLLIAKFLTNELNVVSSDMLLQKRFRRVMYI